MRIDESQRGCLDSGDFAIARFRGFAVENERNGEMERGRERERHGVRARDLIYPLECSGVTRSNRRLHSVGARRM